MTRPPIVVIGVGNPMRGDDGLGPAVVEEMRASARSPSDVQLAVSDGEATRVIELWRGRRLAVLVDAVVSGAEPGTIHRFDGAVVDDVSSWRAVTSSHTAGVSEAVALGTALARLPDRLVVLGVEAGSTDLGEGLSPSVAPTVAALVVEILALAKT